MAVSSVTQLLLRLLLTLAVSALPPDPMSLWNVPKPLNYSDPLYAGWDQIPVVKETKVYNGFEEKRIYAHHPELYTLNDTIFLTWSSAPIDEDSMGQDVWISTSKDGGISWAAGFSLLPAAILPNQTDTRNWTHWCSNGIAQRAWQALTFVYLEEEDELYAIGQSASQWCPSRWNTAGRIARRISMDGKPRANPCWLEKNEFVESEIFNETVYGTEYGLEMCPQADQINAVMETPQHAPAWSPWLYNNGLYAFDGKQRMEENTFAVWLNDTDSATGGYWQRFWRDISGGENSHAAWVEYNEDPDGDGWYPRIKVQSPNPIYETNIPDTGSKQFFGHLSTGDRYYISNPRWDEKDPQRQPLTLAMSRGTDPTFTAVGVLRTNASTVKVPDSRSEPKGRKIAFAYSTAVEFNDTLVVAYSENKVNIWVSVVNIDNLPANKCSRVKQAAIM